MVGEAAGVGPPQTTSALCRHVLNLCLEPVATALPSSYRGAQIVCYATENALVCNGYMAAACSAVEDSEGFKRFKILPEALGEFR